jgi:hypothetical protein
MMILHDNLCKKCNYKCYAIHFQQNFEKWTSGDDDIDKLIQDTQLSDHNSVKKTLEWIPYIRFKNIKCITENKVYKANWIDGKISYWDNNNDNWNRINFNMNVTLKILDNSKNITIEFVNQVY